ncbi:hypothetical protein [Halegenticoccus soli]|uniref:hypothetical protein n=1 Tax=Halegenticoccus soli TaxID=1985678 RepID=UPI000C6DE05C|nr:hypothetical protein [Halegenticoccus soli]
MSPTVRPVLERQFDGPAGRPDRPTRRIAEDVLFDVDLVVDPDEKRARLGTDDPLEGPARPAVGVNDDGVQPDLRDEPPVGPLFARLDGSVVVEDRPPVLGLDRDGHVSLAVGRVVHGEPERPIDIFVRVVRAVRQGDGFRGRGRRSGRFPLPVEHSRRTAGEADCRGGQQGATAHGRSFLPDEKKIAPTESARPAPFSSRTAGTDGRSPRVPPRR